AILAQTSEPLLECRAVALFCGGPQLRPGTVTLSQPPIGDARGELARLRISPGPAPHLRGEALSRGSAGPLGTGHMSRDALPPSIAQLPIVGVTAGALCAIRLLVARARVDDGEFAQDANHDIMLADVAYRRPSSYLRKERLAVDE